jgi:hypothetical protein
MTRLLNHRSTRRPRALLAARRAQRQSRLPPHGAPRYFETLFWKQFCHVYPTSDHRFDAEQIRSPRPRLTRTLRALQWLGAPQESNSIGVRNRTAAP